MHTRHGMLAIALAVSTAAAHAADDDEAWIVRQMAAPMAPGVPVAAERARRVEFGELARLGGRRVQIEGSDGARSRGIVVRADAGSVVLRELRSTGHAMTTLSRADVNAILVD